MSSIARLLLLVTLLQAPAAFAQPDRDVEKRIDQLDLKQLLETPIDVWTATKTVQPSYEAPAVITTVTREQIAVLGYHSIGDLLNHQLGFYLVDDHVLPNAAVRGISGGLYADSSIIKVLVDGHSVAFFPTGGNWLGPELIPLQAVERVEIIRGPASALYGADAFLGVVNIQTRSGQAINGVNATLGAGTASGNPLTDGDVALGISRRMVDFMVAYRRHRDDLSGLELPSSSPAPSIPDYNQGATRARGLDQLSSTAISKLTLRLRTGSELGLFAYFSSMERGAEFGSLYQLANGYDQRNNFFENRISQWQLRAGLHGEHDFSARLHGSLRGAYFQGAPRDDNRLEVGSDFYYIRRQFAFKGGNLDTHLVWTPLLSLRMVGGAELTVDREQLPSRIGIAKQTTADTRAGEEIETLSIRQGDRTFVNTGVYAQGTWNVHQRWLSVTGGVRSDRHDLYGQKLSGRLGLVSSLRPGLHAKLLYGSAFKAPSPLLLYAVPSAVGDVIGNANLEPQRVHTFELQLSYQPWPSLSLMTDVAYNLLTDKTEFVQQGINKIARNIAQARTLSWESSAEATPGDWLQAKLSLELQRTIQESGQRGFVGELSSDAGSIYPRLIVHGHVVVRPPRVPLRVAMLASLIGRRRASANNALLNGGLYTLPPYLLLEANLSTVGWKILREHDQEISFSLSGKNLLGATGPSPGFSGVDYPLAPRTFLLQARLSL